MWNYCPLLQLVGGYSVILEIYGKKKKVSNESTAQKMKKSLMNNFIFCAVEVTRGFPTFTIYKILGRKS